MIYLVSDPLLSSTEVMLLAGTNPQAGNSMSFLPGDAKLHSNHACQASGLKIIPCAAKRFGPSWDSNTVLLAFV